MFQLEHIGWKTERTDLSFKRNFSSFSEVSKGLEGIL